MAAGNEIRAMADKFRAASEKAVPLIQAATVKTTFDTASTAREAAPVDTGYLQSSITTDIELSGSTIAGTVEAGANYAAYVEEGTSRMAPQPYMRPAFDKHREAWIQALEQIGGQAL